MNVKGMAFLARESMVVEDFGEPAWRAFLEAWRGAHPDFPAVVLPLTKVSSELFLDLQESLVKELYRGDREAYWRHGYLSGQYAMTRGQLRGIFKPGEARRLVLFCPQIWRGYFDGGELSVAPAGERMELAITGVAPHLYFEYTVLGFLHGGLQLLDPAAERPRRVKGFSAGDSTVLYEVKV
ncbi:MAG TPA: hypothetical protein VIG99_14625 [Myxococcaceae bacterium]|jgi:hypothetical protein